MATSMRDKIARQLELEDESRALGSARYRAARPLPWRTSTASTDEEAELPPGRKLLKIAVEPTAKAIDEWCLMISQGGAGRRHNAYRLLSQAGSMEIAYLTGRVVLNATALRQTLTATAFQVAALLIEHIEMLLLKEHNKKGFKGVLKAAKKSSTSSKGRQALKKIMNNEGTRLNVPQAEQLSVGIKAIEFLCDATGLFKIEHSTGGRNMMVVPTPFVSEWLDIQHARCELLDPVHLPMVVRPRRWRTPFWGGYLTKRPGVRLVKQWTGAYHSELRHIEMPDVYKAVNTVQEVPWRINERILDLMLQVWDGGGNLGGLPQREDDPIPARPADYEFNEEARKDWARSAAKVHEANAFMLSKRLTIQQRIWVAQKFREEEEIFFPHDLDFRGRIYPIPTGGPHPQGDDPAKALLMFAEGVPLGDDGGYWLAIHVANLFGVDKVSFKDRVEWAFANLDAILDSANDPLDGQRFWTTADSPWCALAACMDFAGYLKDGENHVSHIPVALDGSNSGLQHFSAMLRDPIGGSAVNLLPVDKPQDVYMQVALKAQAMVDAEPTITVTKRDPEGNEVTKTLPNPWLGGKVSRKIAKRPTMTYCYSATRYGMVDMIHQTLREVDQEKGKAYLDGFDNYDAASYLSYVIWEAISQTVVAASGAMAWLRDVAKVTVKAGIPIWWTSPTGLPVLQMYNTMDDQRVHVYIGGKHVKVTIRSSVTGQLNTNAQANGIAPNFVHTHDASHLQAAANACNDAGIKSLAVIHDSFGTHAARARLLSHLLRRTFIEQYEPDVLARFRDEMAAQLPEEFAELIPPLPELGTMDLQSMADADYMFA